MVTADTLDCLDALHDVLDAAHRLRSGVNQRALAVVGLTFEQAVALCRIDLAHGAPTVSELAAQLSRSVNGTTTLLGKVVEKRLVQRERRNTGDKRTVFLSITPEGQAAVAEFTGALPGILRAMGDDRSPVGDMVQSVSTLSLLLEGLRRTP